MSTDARGMSMSTTKNPVFAILQVLIVVSFAVKSGHGQRLSPPAINIAQGKKIEATSTCGEDVSESELFCKLATVPGKLGILGLSCDHCDPSVPSRDHSIEYAIDGTERWWQSPPLSRGLQYQRVNITIDLGQEYQVAYVIIKTGNAPRPGTWALEKSVDGGKTFTPWQYFATDNSDCLTYFGHSALLQSFKDDTTVTCTTSYSQVPPFENGEIHISLVNGRPGASNFSYSQALQEWTRARHIRLRLLKVKTLLADLLPLARQDPSVTRRYFYSIKDISVGGICMCNGHADACVQRPGESQFRCSCKHRTCGVKCEVCCPGFVQKEWKPATAESSNECEPCNCHNHATDCYYSERIAQEKRSLDINGNYEGGGVCVDCKDNTDGINCERCKSGFYRPVGVPKTSRDACQACSCDRRFSSGRCFDGDGQCECLKSYSGPNCDQCNEGFYGFPNCKPCDCHPMGTSGRVCGPTGDQCPCKPNYTGAKCDQCAPGYYGFPNCRRCNCDRVGSLSTDCDITSGQCNCRQMYTARQCNQCSKGFYSFPECKVCNCDAEGTARDICDPNTGVCICMGNFAGSRCDVCNDGYYRFPVCRGCGCSAQGSTSPKCNQFGVCECQENYDGARCDRCRLGYYSYPRCVKCSCDPRGSVHQFCDPNTGQCNCKGSFRGLNCNRCRSGYYGFPDCQACKCNPAGIKPLPDGQLVDCSLSNEGQCNCKDNVQGLACTECKDGYFFLQSSNPLGCNSCECNMDGVIGGLRTCDKFTGQCPCKLYVAGRKCTTCKAGFYGLEGSKVFGCTGCDCDVGGAYDQFCDSSSGQCSCRANIVGRDCSRPAPRHYYPTLLHVMAELEDAAAVPTKQGSVPGQDVLSPDVSSESNGTPVRFGFDENVFPGYSWRGYATMSDLQRALKVTLDIPKTTRYHLIFHSITNESSPVRGQVMLTPKGGVGSKQSSPVTFPVNRVGSTNVDVYHTVGDKDMATQFMLTKGQWDLMVVLPPANVLLDYVAALPQEYYEAYQLENKVTKPCQVNGINTLCNQFSYLSTKKPGLFTTELETGYIIRSSGLEQTQLFEDGAVLQQLDFSAMALLDDRQNRVTADFNIPKSGKYVLVIQYYHPSDNKAKMNVYLRYPQGTQRGEFNLQSCNYRFGCRQVAVDNTGAVKVFDVSELQRMVVTLLARDSSSPIAVDAITAIPIDMWTLDFIAPSILCTTQGSECIPTSYPVPKGAVKIEADGRDPNQPQPPNKQDPGVKLQYLEGPKIHVLVGPVPRPGQYAAIVHYYQPNHASFESQVSVTSDRALDGSVKFHYCPHASGCRSVIRNLNALPSFNIGRNSVALEFTIPENSTTWIDYVLLVPQDLFTEELQEDSPVPLTQEFLDSCSKDHFFIKSSDPKFCKDSVFSLTTSFNNGSFACDCNPKGTLNSDGNCEQFGGQCSCRQNVIGRTCSRCKTGYYGFPNCRKCRCVFCNEFNGACDCPPNTVGPNCEFCLQGTCCYDPILGCQDCGCERFGVKGGDIACNANTGQCNCKPSHTGKKCNKCATGYYDYPLCQKCDSCDPRGVDSRICDSNDGTCFCKPGVTGPRCDQCAAGRFNLDTNNPDGCSECWCNGLSDSCDSGDKYCGNLSSGAFAQCDPRFFTLAKTANLQNIDDSTALVWGRQIFEKSRQTMGLTAETVNACQALNMKNDRSKVVIMDNWQLENSPAIVVKIGETNLYASVSSQREEKGKPIYWLAPKGYLGEKISSYGGKLTYTIRYEVPQGESSPVLTTKPDVVIVGENGKVLQNKRQLQFLPGKTSAIDMQFLEYLWKDSSDANVSRDDFMSVLRDIKSLKLRASYSTVVAEVTINDISMDVAVDGPLTGAVRARSVEICDCPERATGASCELCGKGYTRAPDNATCIPCNCFGHSDDCDGETGKCYNCLHNTTGLYCEVCEPGYYGDATTGSPLDCGICECPLGIMSNSFATGCALNSFNDLLCTCKEGYSGQSCESCADGFYGNPSLPGDYCKRCVCSGNIDPSVNGSCDTQTGQCLKCINAAMGDQCDHCLNGYFGDAVIAKNCARCACSECGTVTAVCNHTNGLCKCKPNVIGDSCDSCKPNTWNFNSCLGCEDCACAPASLSSSCDVKTGQCKCPEGVTGRRCDRCKAGYFDYSAGGCQACNCGKGEDNLFGFCDINTGQCCKPGGNCTICPENYILTDTGCEYCGECVGRLLNTSTELDGNLTQALKSLEQGTAGIIAESRFSDINETLQRLIPPTNEYNTTMEQLSLFVGISVVDAVVNGSSNSTDIKGTLTERTGFTEEETEQVKQMIMKITDKAAKSLENSTFTKEEALALEEEIKEALNSTQSSVDIAEKIANTLKTDKANQTLLLEEAEEILKELVNRNFDAANISMTEEQELLMEAINKAKSMLNDTMSLWNQLIEVNKTLNELFGKLTSILDKTSSILENTSLALDTNNISRSYDSQTPLTEAALKKNKVDSGLESLQDVIQTTKRKLLNGSESLEAFNGSFPLLDDLIDQVSERIANLSQTMDRLTPSVKMAQNHSEELRRQADELEKLLRDIEFANEAVNASQRYSDIAEALKDSLAIAQEAEDLAMDARDESQTIGNMAKNTQNVSSMLNESALQTKDKVDNELSRLLEDIKNRLDLIRNKIQNVSGDLFDVAKNFPEFEEMVGLIGGKARDLGENATQSKMVADDAWEKAEEVEEQLTGLSGLKESIIATNSNITEAEEKVMSALNMSEVIREKVVIQERRQEKIIEELDTEVVRRLDDIRGMMDRAHVLLKHTSLVMKFDGKTTSSPLPPQAVQRQTRALNFLMYLKPEKPDGLILFMGDAGNSNRYRLKRQSPKCSSADFIAVELKAARPHLKLCTSGFYLDLVTNEDILTDVDRWYKLEAGLTGNLAKLSVEYFDENKIKQSITKDRLLARDIQNPKIILNKESDLVVGGVPSKMKLPSLVDAVNYTGCFDGLQVNNHFVGSWNSDPLEKPAKEEFCYSRSGTTEFAADDEDPSRTFFGTGFVKSGPYGDDPMGEMDFKFTTTSSNGILVIGIDDEDTSLFQAMELSDGHVVFSYNMGHGYEKVASKKVYDTGDEVTIVKRATDSRGFSFTFKISSKGVEEVLANGRPFYSGRKVPTFVNADYVYWGGIENRTTIPAQVTKMFFKGCLTSLSLSTGGIKLQASPGFIGGCQVKPAHNVTFLEEGSYLSIDPFLSSQKKSFTIGLSFRVVPQTKNGLIFLEAHSVVVAYSSNITYLNEVQGNAVESLHNGHLSREVPLCGDFIVLGLVDGKVTLLANAGSTPLTLQTNKRFSDGKWHFVTIRVDGTSFDLDVDDVRVSGKFHDKMPRYIQTTQDMYLGGVPDGYIDTVRNRDFDSVFLSSLKDGSIRALTFEDKFGSRLFNFMDYRERNKVIFDNDDYSEQTPKNLIIKKPTGPKPGYLESTTTKPSTTKPSTNAPTTPTQPPVCPMPDKPAQQAGAIGFGYDLNSHVMYTVPQGSVLHKLISSRTRLRFEFRASNPNGILFYSGTSDFIECHLQEGRVSCSFTAGGGILILTSPQDSYSDGKWHSVRFMREKVNGTLYVDDEMVETGLASGGPTVINALKEVFLGGTPDNFDAKRVPSGSRVSLPGCIRNVTVDTLDIGPPTNSFKTENCYRDSPSSGVSFENGGGFLNVAKGYTVGQEEIIMLEIKPTSHTGVLLSSSSTKGDYIVLEMIDGNIVFRAENGGGQLVVEYTADNPLQLCDGQWHAIKATKDKTVVKLQVDGGSILEGGGKGSQKDANIYDPLYVGGLPEGEVGKGVTATEPFTGCIRNLQSMDPGKQPKTLHLTKPIDMAGNVYLGGCPYN